MCGRFGPKKFHTDDAALRDPCSVSDWLSRLARENSKPSNIQSETLRNNNNIKQFIGTKKTTNLKSKTLGIPDVVNRAKDRIIFYSSRTSGHSFRRFSYCVLSIDLFISCSVSLLAQNTLELAYGSGVAKPSYDP